MPEDQDEPGNAVKTSVSLPPYLHDWLKKVTQSKKIYPKYGKFTSSSGVVVVALSELKGRIEAREEYANDNVEPDITEESNVIEVLLNAYLKTPKGKKYLQNFIKQLDHGTVDKGSHLEYVE